MPHINHRDKEVAFKVVYYGPGLSGKTTNLKHVYSSMKGHAKSDMVILNTKEERTLFFDFVPVELGTVGEFSVRLNIYTVPGQVYYEASRRLILEGSDGVIFVADSQQSQLEENLQSFEMLKENLRSYGVDWRDFPIVLQYNKRDVLDPLPLGTLESKLDLNGIQVFEAVATEGHGVMETIRTATRQIIERFQI